MKTKKISQIKIKSIFPIKKEPISNILQIFSDFASVTTKKNVPQYESHFDQRDRLLVMPILPTNQHFKLARCLVTTCEVTQASQPKV